MYIPVLIEPVIDLSLSVNWVSKVGWSWRGNPELCFFSAENIIDEFLVLSLVVLLNDTEASILW